MLDKLCSYKALRDNHEMLIPENEEFVNVSNLSFLKLNTYSDINVKVNLEWSYNGKQTGVINSNQTGSKLWRHHKVDILMPFLRVRILNDTGLNSEELVVHFFTKNERRSSLKFVEATRSMSPKPTPRGLEDLQLEEESHKLFTSIREGSERLSSNGGIESDKPKKRTWFAKKEKPSPLIDSRLPAFIPQGALLIGGNKGQIIAVPRGAIGEFLMIGESGNPCWLLPQPKILQKTDDETWVI